MTRILPRVSRSGFSLIDLLFAMLLTSVILIGAYRAFLSNLRHTSQTLDLARLDVQSRNLVEKFYSDISESNGNVLNGTPTVFPLVSSDSSFNGFMLVQAEKRLPVLEIAENTFRPSLLGNSQITLKSSSMNEVDFEAAKPGRFAILYNFGNYSWIPFIIRQKQPSTIQNQVTLTLERFSSDESRHWSKYLSTPICKDYMYKKPENIEHTVCTVPSDEGNNGEYQRFNTVFIIADIVTYGIEADKLVRKLNEEEDNAAIIATDVEEFVPIFNTNENQIYPGPRLTSHSGGGDNLVTKIDDFDEFIRNLVPKNSPSTIDDCLGQINYACMDKSNSLTKLAYGYVSQNIKGIDISISMKRRIGDNTDEESTSRGLKKLHFYLALDQNHGFTSLSAFPPTRVVASKMESTGDRNYGSIMSQGFFVKDPMGGTLSAPPFYTAVAPMISAVEDVVDPTNDQKTQDICSTCTRNAQGKCPGYPWVCNTQYTVDETTYDYRTCQGNADAQSRMYAFCLNPQGSLNDRGLEETNVIDPMIVALGSNTDVLNRISLKQNCSTQSCPLASGYYDLYPGLFTDTPFPLTIEPHFGLSGALDKVYLGVARLRIPFQSDYQNYNSYYGSTVFAIDYSQDPPLTTMIRNTPPNELPIGVKEPPEDLASVSDLQILRTQINGQQYDEMLMSSIESNRIISRRKLPNAQDYNWSNPILQIKDETLQPVKYSMRLESGGWMGIETARYPDGTERVLWENPRIASFYAPDDKTIFYATQPMMPDLAVNGQTGDGLNQWFYDNEVHYQIPITRPDNREFYLCDPNGDTRKIDPDNSDLNPMCTIRANQAKPIWWNYCAGSTNASIKPECFITAEGTRPPQFPVASGGFIPNYSASLKVAFKQDDGEWNIIELAKLHGTVTGITQNPLTRDLLLASRNNILSVSYEELNKKLADMMDPNVGPASKKPLQIDLSYFWEDKNMYAANNVLNKALDPESPFATNSETRNQNLELLRLSGFNVNRSNNLQIFFSDSLNRVFGYIYQLADSSVKRLFAQIIYRQDNALPHDANLDEIAVHKKGIADLKEETAKWLIQNSPSKVWADTAVLDENGKARYGVIEPIPVPPPRNITECMNSTTTNKVGCLYQRKLSNENMNCIYNPSDPKVAGFLGVRCGQDPHFRACDGDVLASVGVGYPGRQMGFTGCGLGAAPHEDPTILPPSPDPGGGGRIEPEPGFGDE